VGLAATAVYYLNKEGVWKESHESLKTYNRLNTTLEPYIKEVQKQIPFEVF
jgi:adenylosuccinate synthase